MDPQICLHSVEQQLCAYLERVTPSSLPPNCEKLGAFMRCMKALSLDHLEWPSAQTRPIMPTVAHTSVVRSVWTTGTGEALTIKLFFKYNSWEASSDLPPLLMAEAEGLAVVNEHCSSESMRTPFVLLGGIVRHEGICVDFVLMEYTTLLRGGDEQVWASRLTAFHSTPVEPRKFSPRFLPESSILLTDTSDAVHPGESRPWGFFLNNSCGSTLVRNPWTSHWGDFFTDSRLIPLFAQLARRDRFSNTKIVCDKSRYFLNAHESHIQPSLVHGDLWAGNMAFCQPVDWLAVEAALKSGFPLDQLPVESTQPIFFDICPFVGDREVDHGMMALHGCPRARMAGVMSQWEPPARWTDRRSIYNLFHQLNHLLLFGNSYLPEVKAAMDFVASLINKTPESL
ncbi:MAG: hypothetical protein KVP17_002661 [Porospora cf. gigantea B]|uniref:uncharacterized protein n=1 Tax=Porospora cf. gigantea B TaxID=2853592 RepID=UPI003571A52F|nr:MAG: hypothetical protein KVP17_002661 [Porospora cf. gigantea B]